METKEMNVESTQILDESSAVLLNHGLTLSSDGFVRWGKNNPDHPRNWSFARKAYDTSLIIFLDFFTTATSTMGAPAGEYSKDEFGLSSTLATFIFVSLYLFGQGLGGIVFPPYSECFGRKRLYVISTALYSVFCVVVGISPSLAGVIVGRFTTGFLSAVPTIVVAGSIEDLWDFHARVWLMFAWAMVANMGLVVGPIVSSYMSLSLGWRWVFYMAAIVNAITGIFLLGMKESRPSLLLARKVAYIRKTSGIDDLVVSSPDHMPDMQTFIRIALFRPLYLFFTEPIVFTVAVLSAVAFALIYLFTEAIPLIYSSYDLTLGQQSLPFVAIGVGLTCGVFTRCYDHYMLKRRVAQGLVVKPEDKIVGFMIGAPALAIGLWWFAWTIPPAATVNWVIPTISLVFIGYALNEFDTVQAGYLADSYLAHAASGFGALSLLRSIFSGCFPLFAKVMFQEMGYNFAGTVLAVLATIFCVVPFLFAKYGERLRKRSKFASFSLAVNIAEGLEEN
ncbi:hypothetical protein ACHAQJ_007967 [Trichoderma viride]